MRLFNSLRPGAIAAAMAFTAMTAPAQAATYVLDLTGVVADATTFTAGGNTVLSLGLSYFDPFFVEVGDEVTVNVSLDDFLLVPAAANQIFVLDMNGNFDPADDLNESSTQFSLFDGELGGQTFFSGCSNCFSAVLGRFPGAAFSVQNLSATFTIDAIGQPIEFTNAELGYQLSAGTGGGAVPEPSTWAVMILGFGLAGAALRRRTKFARA